MNVKMSNKVYDVLKYIAIVVLPAISALYFGLAQFWNLPYAEQICGTIALVATFLGQILRISNKQYKEQNKTVKEPEEDEEEI